jgi:transposase
VQRIWKKHHLQPHRVEKFKLSTDPQFVAKVRDIVGLYLHPPEHALVLSVDEKSQIQALDRTQPILPLRPGLGERQTHDYERHGTTTLFAALNVAAGKVIAQCQPRHRHQEFLRFLKQIDDATDPALDIHLILDDYSTHAQASASKALVPGTPSSSPSLYPDQRLLAEPGRTLVCRDHTQTHPSRHLSFCARPRPSNPGLYPPKQ